MHAEYIFCGLIMIMGSILIYVLVRNIRLCNNPNNNTLPRNVKFTMDNLNEMVNEFKYRPIKSSVPISVQENEHYHLDTYIIPEAQKAAKELHHAFVKVSSKYVMPRRGLLLSGLEEQYKCTKCGARGIVVEHLPPTGQIKVNKQKHWVYLMLPKDIDKYVIEGELFTEECPIQGL